MSVGWSSLPLLPLRCILEYLDPEDALAATSVCRHWRDAVLLYEGRKNTLKLRAKQTERNTFLVRLFRKHVRQLQLHMDGNAEEVEDFMTHIVPQFLNTLELQELLVIGPNYSTQSQHIPIVKLKRIIIESLVYKHLHCIQKLVLFGCEMDTTTCEEDRYIVRPEWRTWRVVEAGHVQEADSVLSRSLATLMTFSTLQHIMIDYDQINTAALATLSQLSCFTSLTLSVRNKRGLRLERMEWPRGRLGVGDGIDVAVQIIGLPYRRFNEVIEKVLVEGMNLTSLKVMFCKTLYTPLLTHLVRVHRATLRELVWADAPHSADTRRRHRFPYEANVNPFILLCWQCTQLRRLVLHGYWVWQYDVLGFVRLRKTLEQLEISAIYSKQNRFQGCQQASDNVIRVLDVDTPRSVDQEYIQQVNSLSELRWSPPAWPQLHPALRPRATARHRADFLLREAAVLPASFAM